MLSPELLLKPQNTTTSLLFSKISNGSTYLNESNTKQLSSLTYNTLQFSQPSYIRQLFTIKPSRSTRSSSALTLLRPSVTSPLKFADRSIAIAVPPLWNKLPPALKKLSDPSYEITKSPPLAVSPQ